MALPTLEKTYRFAVNLLVPPGVDVEEMHYNAYLALYFGLQGKDYTGANLSWTDSAGAGAAAPVLWQVESSCDGTSFGNNDQVNHITTTADVNWGDTVSSARTWFQLSNSAIGIQIAHSYRSVNTGVRYNQWAGQTTAPDNGNWVASINGFGTANGGTNGTATARPQATDEVQFLTSGSTAVLGTSQQTWIGSPLSTQDHRLHIIASTDGEVWRMLLTRNGFTVMMLAIEKNRDAVVLDPDGTPHTQNGDDTPYVACYQAATSDSATNRALRHDWMSSANGQKFMTHLGTLVSSVAKDSAKLYLTGEQIRNNTIGFELEQRLLSELDGRRPLNGIGLFCEDASHRGRVGRLTDMWWGHDTDLGVAEGDTYPNDATRQFIAFSAFVLPWNGSVPLLS